MENNNVTETPKEPESPPSQTVVGIRFRSCGKVYTFDIQDIDAAPGARVVVDSEMGLSLGRVVTPKQIIEKTRQPLKKVLRVATEKDFETVKSNRSLEDEAKMFCVEKVNSLNLPMKIVTTETTMDKKRLIFYFTADGRIDFRELVRDLAARFKTRIEMRQIGVRDEVKLLGGFGVCGRQTCCSLFLTSFAPITIRMAKQQSLSINQSKLSGICGRLMCCLGYEYRENAGKEAASRPKITKENDLETAGHDQIPDETTADQAEKTASTVTPEQKVTPLPPGAEKTTERDGKEQKRFGKDPRRRRRRRPAKASPESTQGKTQEAVPAEKAEQSESKGKGRSSRKRRKFWKKKKPTGNGPETSK